MIEIVHTKQGKHKRLKKRLERLVGAVLKDVREDELRLEAVDKLLEVRRLLNDSNEGGEK